MWTILKTESANNWLDFEPVTILHEYDRPTIFTSKGADGSLYLAYFCGKDTQSLRYLVVPFNELRQCELVTGKISLREVFDVPKLWIFDLNFNWEPVTCWEMTPRELPRHLLP